MLSSLILAVSFQVGPFYQQKPSSDYWALRPFVSHEESVTDVLWPVFTSHRDWWRFCYLAYWQDHPERESYQFTLLPVWFNGRDAEGESYWGLFPIYGRHPHMLGLNDFTFALWPLYHSYSTPRGRDSLVSRSVLFPFVSWRSDGAWSVWPLYGVNYQRESDHRYVLWPIVTWASYREDRDTAGGGYSWMVWPLWASVHRERENQESFLPPFFSYASTTQGAWRLRCPWPFVDIERTRTRSRTSIWPFYERVVDLDYVRGDETAHVTRFGWKLVEIYDDETRVFPFWASGRDHFRIWPFWESETEDDVTYGRFLSLIPVRWIPSVDRNWSKFWTLYESESTPVYTDHSLFWGIIRWRTLKE